ncbi:MAG: co-chaperone GroES [Candidatus Moraniibacteriota bacterium]
MSKTNVRPLGENILIAPEKAEKKTSAGIYLPENASEERPQQGKVVAVGESEKIKVKKGQTVIYTRYGGTEVKIDGEEYLLVTVKDVLAVVEK